VIHAYPTKTEAIREAAMAYNRRRLSGRLLARLRRCLPGGQ
jgi:hypothetical protein